MTMILSVEIFSIISRSAYLIHASSSTYINPKERLAILTVLAKAHQETKAKAHSGTIRKKLKVSRKH
jgi:exopolyphosphatase/pppGpp-phosphohydrolase